ncbi:Y-family DNA polymerase (plasmid) [Chryseobacterium sp. JJR-5R]|uniref:Y-family DNA polymerase n=1 Tax=Chryseobacterium sp. JJR-5R TaxID=3093923 RepID=UPI002A754FF3|nr:Y-family DNA polymerase [Chryseobacterium sp. JJR-5R]WPO84634.1 Y-family DNA polymerase [Chryseobacterium sp. JJR-5R]
MNFYTFTAEFTSYKLMFALVDCNNFYASSERAFQPELNKKPVVVLSNNDGCVIARSNEAKELGIKMGLPAFMLKSFISDELHIFSSNYELYDDMSRRVMNTLSEFTPEVEIYSIDEIFLKFTGFENYDLNQYGQEMKRTVMKNCWIPVSVGFAPTKALAKVANKIAKKFPEHLNGVHVIDTEEKRIKALKWFPIEDVWGIGRQLSLKLSGWGIRSAYDFTQLPDYTVQKELSIVGLRLKKELSGLNYLDLEETQRKKAIATTRSFARDEYIYDNLMERVSTFATRCAEKLRKEKSYCSKVEVFLITNRYKENEPQYGNKVIINLPFPSNSSITITKYARKALYIIYKQGYGYKKTGVVVHGITPEPYRQGNLFLNEDHRHEKLMKVMDSLNVSKSDPVIALASQDLKKREKMLREKLSQCYTTKWNDLILIS